MNVLEVDFEKKLKNFPLHIQFQAEGGCIGILGASGCGKSMTFKAIAGIATPDSGKICLGKRELFHRGHKVNLPPRKRSVGYLFQSYALFPNMTVFQNIEAGIQGKKAAKRERAMEMMENFICQSWHPAIPPVFPEDSSREWPWRGYWLVNRNCSFWTSRFLHWTVT